MTAGTDRGSELRNLRAPALAQRAEALARIAQRGDASPEELDAMAVCLGATEKVLQRRAAEAFADLERAGRTVAQRLAASLRCDDARTRWGAAYALSLIGVPPVEARAVLLESFGSVDGDIRWAAAEIVLRGPLWPEAVADLCRLLSEGSSEQKKMAAYTLRGLNRREPSVEAALKLALADRHPNVRIAALSALLNLAADRNGASTTAVALLGDPHAGVRRAAAAMLGHLGTATPGAIEALRHAATSDDESLRRAATGSLRKLGADGA